MNNGGVRGFDRHHFILSCDVMRVITFPESLNGETGLVCSRARLEDFLRTVPVETLLKVKKRLDRPEAKVRDREGCYKLIVSGGPGRGLTLDLRE